MPDILFPFLFSFHVFLLAAKIWFIWVLFDMFKLANASDQSLLMFKKRNVMLLLFVLFMGVLELWYIWKFYSDVNLFIYNYLSIFDQIILTVLLALSYKGGN